MMIIKVVVSHDLSLLLGLQDEIQQTNADNTKRDGRGARSALQRVRVVIPGPCLELAWINTAVVSSHC